MSQKVSDLDYDFDELLDEAEAYAKGAWEEGFVSDLRERHDLYGASMYLTERQEDILKRIAKW